MKGLELAEAYYRHHGAAIQSEQAIQAIKDQGLSDVESDFLFDHASAIHGKIKDDRLKQRLTVVP